MADLPRLDPFSVSASFRAYAYDSIVMAWESGKVNVNSATYDKRRLNRELGISVQNLKKLQDVQESERGNHEGGEFLVFHIKGKGHECLFKHLRNTFAHGHYGSTKQGWVIIRHRYKERGVKSEQTRIFGQVSVSTLKKLVAFLDTANSVVGGHK